MSAHAKLSASGSHRWLNCAGSVEAESTILQASSIHAEEGTAAHELAEYCLTTGTTADSVIGQVFNGFTVDNYMSEFVQSYIDYIRAISGEHHYEVRVDFSEWVPEGFGTSDCIIVTGDTLHVIDLKYGKGLKVDSFENSQAMLYALGALKMGDNILTIDKIICTIIQPRLDSISEFEISTNDLLEWGESIKPKALLALTPNAPRTPSEYACNWCAAKAQCLALKQHTEKVLMLGFDEMDSTEITTPSTLNDHQLRLALENKKLIIGWLDAVEEVITKRLFAGESFEGFKIVAGRGSRVWGDEEIALLELENIYQEKAFVKKLISPAQAEKLVGKKNLKDIEHLILKKEGSPTLARVDDKRPSLGATVENFNDFD